MAGPPEPYIGFIRILEPVLHNSKTLLKQKTIHDENVNKENSMSNTQGTIIITGVAGFIGSHVARYFSEHGWGIIGIDSTPVSEDLPVSLSSYHCLNLPDPAFSVLLKASSPQLCIHCAGSASVGQSINDISADFYANTVLTFEVLNALRVNAPNCRLLFLSSAAVYGNPASLPIDENQPPAPISPYGFHKLQCEQLCEEFSKIYDLSTASVRIFSAYGRGLRRQVIWDICKKSINQKSITLQGTGKESRDFVHVIDIAKALMAIATSAPMNGEFYNIGSGRETKIAELANMVIAALGHSYSIRFDGVIPSGTPLNWQADISKIAALGYIPSISLEEGIKTFVDWCRLELEDV